MGGLLKVSMLLTVLLALSLAGASRAGAILGYPFNFANRKPLPTDPPFDGLLPLKIGPFTRQALTVPMHFEDQPYLRVLGAATYTYPGDEQHSVYVEVRLYSTQRVASMLLDPSDWPLHTRDSDKYYVPAAPIPSVYSQVRNGIYNQYSLEYVSGRWNVIMRTINSLERLVSFANLYPY